MEVHVAQSLPDVLAPSPPPFPDAITPPAQSKRSRFSTVQVIQKRKSFSNGIALHFVNSLSRAPLFEFRETLRGPRKGVNQSLKLQETL